MQLPEELKIAHMQVSTCPQCGAPIYILVASSTDLTPWQQDVPPEPEYSCECRNMGHTWVKHNG
jgi:hypothetical protein